MSFIVKLNQRFYVSLQVFKKWAIAYYRISISQNSILIDPTFILKIAKLSTLEIFLFAVFSYCTINILYLNCFRDYPQRGTQYRFGFSVVTSLLVVESITRQ